MFFFPEFKNLRKLKERSRRDATVCTKLIRINTKSARDTKLSCKKKKEKRRRILSPSNPKL